jgi:hypothetical protein
MSIIVPTGIWQINKGAKLEDFYTALVDRLNGLSIEHIKVDSNPFIIRYAILSSSYEVIIKDAWVGVQNYTFWISIYRNNKNISFIMICVDDKSDKHTTLISTIVDSLAIFTIEEERHLKLNDFI